MLKNKKTFFDMLINNEISNDMVSKLLMDHTTGKNIVWATDTYTKYGDEYSKDHQMFMNGDFSLLKNKILVPRVFKPKEEQDKRTKNKAEVFTPTWIINRMNNYCDEQWFNKKNVFNIENEDNTWLTIDEKVCFDNDKVWKDYVDSKRIEITCGEAPYLVSRYDATTGKIIDLKDRIGILDRKIRIVNENAKTDKTWMQWVYRAFQSVYGFEYQGDSLLIARINLVDSFLDYYYNRFNDFPNNKILSRIIDIVSWNIWQMDGIYLNSPSGIPLDQFYQLSLEDLFNQQKSLKNESFCLIKDWKEKKEIEYRNIGKGDN